MSAWGISSLEDTSTQLFDCGPAHRHDVGGLPRQLRVAQQEVRQRSLVDVDDLRALLKGGRVDVFDADEDHLVTHGQGLNEVIRFARRRRLGAVGDDHDEAASARDCPDSGEELGDVRMRGGERDVFLDAAQHRFGVRVTGAGGHEAHALVVTGNEADLVSAGHAQPCDGLAGREGDLFLRLSRRGERAHLASRVDDEHDL